MSSAQSVPVEPGHPEFASYRLQMLMEQVGIAERGAIAGLITHNVWLRAGADYLHTSKDGATVNGVRALGGITFVFGGRGEAPARDQTAPARRTTAPTPRATRATAPGMRIDALGVTVTLGRSTGAEITDEAPNGVAALAGFHPGDVINVVDGKPVKTPMELAAELSNRQAGDKVRLGYLLHGAWQTDAIVVLAP